MIGDPPGGASFRDLKTKSLDLGDFRQQLPGPSFRRTYARVGYSLLKISDGSTRMMVKLVQQLKLVEIVDLRIIES